MSSGRLTKKRKFYDTKENEKEIPTYVIPNYQIYSSRGKNENASTSKINNETYFPCDNIQNASSSKINNQTHSCGKIQNASTSKIDNGTYFPCENIQNASTSKINYQTYFFYGRNQNQEKIGRCLLCQAKNVIKEVKMKNSNTSGLKFHLNKDHRKEYEILFGTQLSTVSSSLYLYLLFKK